MTKPMTDERLAHWDNMIEVFQDSVSVEAGRCAYECVTEISRLRAEVESQNVDYDIEWKENDRLKAEVERLKANFTIATGQCERQNLKHRQKIAAHEEAMREAKSEIEHYAYRGCQAATNRLRARLESK